MIEVFQDHLAQLPFLELPHEFTIHLFLCELPGRNFRNEQNAMPVGVIQDEVMLRVMDGTRKHFVERFQIVVIGSHGAYRFGGALTGGIGMACDAYQTNWFPIQIEISTLKLDRTDSHGYLVRVQNVP